MPSRSTVIALAVRLLVAGAGLAAIAPAFGAPVAIAEGVSVGMPPADNWALAVSCVAAR